MNEYVFSICIPVYNTERYLRCALDSIVEQTFDAEKVETIIVNDGSPHADECDAIISDYARELSIQYIKKEKNEGSFLARKTAVQKASGNYLLFLDSDDWLERDALKVLAKELQIYSVDYLEFYYYMVREGGKKELYTLQICDRAKKYEDIVSSRANHTIWNKCYNARTLKPLCDTMPDFYALMSEDYYQIVILEYFFQTRKMLTVPLYNYRITTGISHMPYFDDMKKVKDIDTGLHNIAEHLSLFLKKKIGRSICFPSAGILTLSILKS